MNKSKLLSYLAAASAVASLPAHADVISRHYDRVVAEDVDREKEDIDMLEKVTIDFNAKSPLSFGNTSVGKGADNTLEDAQIIISAPDQYINGKGETINNSAIAESGSDIKISPVSAGTMIGDDMNANRWGNSTGLTEDGFLAVSLFLDGDNYYGWIKYKINEKNGKLIVKSMAIQTEPNVDIKAGSITNHEDNDAANNNVSAIDSEQITLPESLSQLAEGAEGLRFYRQAATEVSVG